MPGPKPKEGRVYRDEMVEELQNKMDECVHLARTIGGSLDDDRQPDAALFWATVNVTRAESGG